MEKTEYNGIIKKINKNKIGHIIYEIYSDELDKILTSIPYANGYGDLKIGEEIKFINSANNANIVATILNDELVPIYNDSAYDVFLALLLFLVLVLIGIFFSYKYAIYTFFIGLFIYMLYLYIFYKKSHIVTGKVISRSLWLSYSEDNYYNNIPHLFFRIKVGDKIYHNNRVERIANYTRNLKIGDEVKIRVWHGNQFMFYDETKDGGRVQVNINALLLLILFVFLIVYLFFAESNGFNIIQIVIPCIIVIVLMFLIVYKLSNKNK